MLKRSASRNQRSRGVRAKHVLQIVVLLGVCFWLIYQVKYSHDKRSELSGKDAELSKTERVSSDVAKLGRKDLNPRVEEIGGKNEKHTEEEEEEEDKHEEGEHEVEEEREEEMSRPEVKQSEETRGQGEEDEQGGEEEEQGEEKEHDVEEEEKEHEVEEEEKEHEVEEEEETNGDGIEDQHKPRDEFDQEEDFIDEEKEREEDSPEDKDTAEDNGEEEEEEKHGQVEDENQNLDEDEAHDEVDRSTHEAREEQYKGDDASSAVTHDSNQLIGSEVNLDFANESKIATNTAIQLNDEDTNGSKSDGKERQVAEKGLNLKVTGVEDKDNLNGTVAAQLLEDSPPQNLTVSSENNGAEIAIGETKTEDLSTSPPNGTETVLHSPQVQNSTIDGVDNSNTTSVRKEADTVIATPDAVSMESSNSTGTDLDSAISGQRLASDNKGDGGGNIRLPSTKKENNTQNKDSVERQDEPGDIKTG